ncbi:MAG: hypothetical protein K1060chlam5_00678 [Candidatus Anoxychlamydiales bacterium]|nr:hypothetical protein [Candidatus Anoxychlamydiales bacterium]
MKLRNDLVFDPIRNAFVKASPEEIVRQKLIKHMLALNYPKSFIAVEKDLKSLNYINFQELSKRRADILVFGKNIHPAYNIYPLLLVECKASLTKSAIEQALGYNYHINAYFVAVADKNNIFTYFYDKSREELKKINYLPKYNELIKAIL